ncbi:SusC/RagA family TonB-linked outer membrane protein [Puia sp.]|jgi:TonB-linked SusC/RagA family outer membrane protein|uniref:SusC/RagA family TonB-linked outer membrane protein n=1 Tax=Puia sp. TaxID=2045100 RepID=UPI002F419D4C
MRKLILCLVATLLVSVLVEAQNREVTGKVTDSTGNPLAGASINVKGARGGTSAGPDGSFRINVPSGRNTLVVSAVGFVSQDIPIGAGGALSVTLMRETRNLNEVVVTALGIRKEKRSLTTAQQTIDGNELNKSGTGNPLGELEGKASGLTVIQSTGDPGGGTYLRLRGATSITGNNQPLLVVDGMPIDNSINNFDATAGAGNNSNGANGNLIGGQQPTNRGNDLNPNDIESINVLKGPAATALYGLQAASGAIVITTKKGGPGRRTSVSFNSSVTLDKVGLLPKLQDQWSQGSNGQYAPPESGASTSWGAKIDTLAWDGATDYPYDKHGNIVGKSSPNAKMPVTPYDRYNFFKTGLTYNNNISLSGGNESSGYRLSLGNVSQTGIIPKAKYEKTTLSLSGSSKISNRLSTTASINYIHSTNYKVQQGSNISGVMLGLVRTPVTFDNSDGFGSKAANHREAYEFPDGTQRAFRGNGGYDNPFWVVNNAPTHSDLDRVFGLGQADFIVAPWISLTYRVGGDVYAQNDKTAYDINSSNATAGAIYLNNYHVTQFNSDFIVNLHKNFGDDWQTSLLIGHNYFTSANNNQLTTGNGFNVSGFYDISNAQSYLAAETDIHKRTMAFYADLELNYKKMLFLSVTARDETSSTLPAAHNTFFYPSASLGWVFTELPSMKESNLLSFGKLRASFAQVGKDAAPYSLNTPYTTALFNDGFTGGIQFPANGSAGYQISSAIATLGNPDLKPENTFSYEGGVDLGFLRNRLTFNATVYYSKTKDGIMPVSIPFTTGFAGTLVNGPTITNKGLELTLDGTPVQTAYGLKWNVIVNWSRNVSKIVKLYPGIQTFFMGGFGSGGEAGIYAVQGAPFGVIYGNTNPHSVPTDLKSPLLIDDRTGSASYAQPLSGAVGPNVILGNPAPDWTGSVISNLSYKGVMLGVQIDVRHGGAMWNGTRGALANKGTALETSNRGEATVFKGLLGHLDDNGNVVHNEGGVEKPGPGAANTIQSTFNQFYWQNTGNSFGGGQETDIENGGFTRIRQLSLSYDLPRKMLNKGPIKTLSLTVFANNLHVWTKYDGVDPETSLGGPSNVQGLDYFNNPNTKSYGLRLNLGL